MTGAGTRSRWCRATRSRLSRCRSQTSGRESDTWFLAGELTGKADRVRVPDDLQQEPARRDRRRLLHARTVRPRQRHVRDIHRLRHAAGEHEARRGGEDDGGDEIFDMTYDSGAGNAVWRTCRDEKGDLVPYTYDVTSAAPTSTAMSMRVDLHVTPTRAPVPLGAADYSGKIECFGQEDTYSYFQTGMTMTGTLRGVQSTEQVTGNAGHVDRQWFPLIANGGAGRRHPRARPRMAHHQSRQRCRPEHLAAVRPNERNALQPFSGATTSSPDRRPRVCRRHRGRGQQLRALARGGAHPVPAAAPSAVHADRHRLTSQQARTRPDGRAAGACARTRPAPGIHGGPYRYRGTLRGNR